MGVVDGRIEVDLILFSVLNLDLFLLIANGVGGRGDNNIFCIDIFLDDSDLRVFIVASATD